jgi:hypothetical protein
MGGQDILAGLRADGLLLTLTADGLSASPRANVKEVHRTAIRANRAVLIEELAAEKELLEALIASINRCCEARGDDVVNRAGLIEGCAALNPQQQVEMHEHFQAEAARFSFPPRRGDHAAD